MTIFILQVYDPCSLAIERAKRASFLLNKMLAYDLGEAKLYHDFNSHQFVSHDLSAFSLIVFVEHLAPTH